MTSKDAAVIANRKGYYFEVKAGKRYLWCQCGRSKSQPFCDGSHLGSGFLPVLFTAERDEDVIFCGCKQTRTGPFCDGSHSNLPGGYLTDDPDSPDLLQAESTLIAAAGVLEFTTRNLARLRELYKTRAVSQKEMEQVASDQQTAEGALRAARDSVRLFGKTDAEIDRIIAERKADPILVVPSPITGRITARNAAPGLFVQPGNPPAPYSVADISTMWMLANVAENDSPAFRVGQEVTVKVNAFPDRTFDGRISTIGSMVDPTTRRVLVRSEVQNPRDELRSGMFATFVIRTGAPVRSVAVPLNGVVREGDGTMTVWVTADRRRFTKRTVQVGLQRDGYRQILDGVQPGELVATEGALFLSNALATASR